MTKAIQAVAAFTLIGALAACERDVLLQGQRFDVRTPLETVAAAGDGTAIITDATAANKSTPIRLAAPTTNADWTHRGGNALHTMPHLALAAMPGRIWSTPIGAGDARRTRITAAPIVAEGKVFVMDALSRVSAVSTAGAVVWSVDAVLPGEATDAASGGGLAYGGGKVYVTTGFGELIALDAGTGAVAWRQRFGSPIAGAPTVAGDTVYVSARDAGGWSVNAADGKLGWVVTGVPNSAGRITAGSPAVTADLVMFPYASGEVIAVNRKTGTPAWIAIAAGPRPGRAGALIGDVTGDPVVVGAVTYAGSAAGRTIAVETRTGVPVWNAPEGAIGPVFPVAGSVFLVSDIGRLIRLDAATGAELWGTALPGFTAEGSRRQRNVVAHFGPLVAGGRVVIASSDAKLRFFTPEDGALTHTVDLPSGVASAPAVAGGVLYVVTSNGQLHAFR